MAQVTGRKVATTPITPTPSGGNVINSWNTLDNKETNAPSMKIVKDGLDEINDNLAQTPITVGGETLSTIDDKLNYLCETKDRVQDVYATLGTNITHTMLKDIKHAVLVRSLANGMASQVKINNVIIGNITNKITRDYAIAPTGSGYGAQVAWDIELKKNDVISTGNGNLFILDTDYTS